ncbi:MAG TPA: hypothetical protein VGC30_12510 [Dokdonella sp.]
MIPAHAPVAEASGQTGLALRLAQRAFAALIDAAAANATAMFATLRAAQLRQSARRTLSALSADDRARLLRWLTLQLASVGAGAGRVRPLLARVDTALAASVAAELARVREELRAPASRADVSAA